MNPRSFENVEKVKVDELVLALLAKLNSGHLMTRSQYLSAEKSLRDIAQINSYADCEINKIRKIFLIA